MTDGKGLERCYSSNEEGDDRVLGCSVDTPASMLGSWDGERGGGSCGVSTNQILLLKTNNKMIVVYHSSQPVRTETWGQYLSSN